MATNASGHICRAWDRLSWVLLCGFALLESGTTRLGGGNRAPPRGALAPEVHATPPPPLEVCALCCWKCFAITVCGECKEHYCAKCIDTHTCGDNTVC